MRLIIGEDGGLIHDNCGGEVGRKRLMGSNLQYVFCKSCNKGVVGNPVKVILEGAEVRTPQSPEHWRRMLQ